MRPMTAILALVLAACSTPSDVVRLGPDSYRIRPTSATAPLSEADFKAFGLKRAGEYCTEQGKHSVVTVAATSDWFSWSGRNTDVRFVCDDRSPAAAAGKASSP